MSLQVWLPLNGNLKNQGLKNITVTNHNATISTSGKIGSCYEFAGTDSYITINPEAMTSFSQGCSVAFWLKINDWNTSYCTIFQAGTNTQAWGGYIFGCLRDSSTSTLNFTVGNVSTTTTNTMKTPALEINKWYHICYVYRDGKCYIYIDGKLRENEVMNERIFTPSVQPDFSKITRITLGKSSSYNHYQSHCDINDLRIYNHGLSDKEVNEIAKGLICHYKMDQKIIGNENLIAGSKSIKGGTYPESSYSDKYSTTTLSIPSGSVYTLSFDAKSTIAGDKMRTHYYSPNTTTTCISSQGITKTATDGNMDFTLTTEWQRYYVIYNQSSTTAVKHLICPRLSSGQGTGTVSVKNIKFEEGSIPTAWTLASSEAGYLNTIDNKVYDTSGYNNNGIITNTNSKQENSIRYNHNLWIDGTTSHIEGSVLPALEDLTINMWVKPDSLSSGFAMFIDGTNDIALCYSASQNSISVSKSSYQVFQIGAFAINIWTMLTLVKIGDTKTLYINGVPANKMGTSTNSWAHSASKFWLFSKSTNTYQYTGAISDFRIYATALSAAAIKELYETSASIDEKGNVYGRELVE